MSGVSRPTGSDVSPDQIADYVAVDQVWRKSDGTALVRIGRVWTSEHFCGGGTFVRCHPFRGKVWFTTIEEFLKRYVRWVP